MKLFFLALMISSSAFADVPSFWPKTSNCSEIKDAMTQYGSVIINVKYLFGSEQFPTYPTEPDCDVFHIERKMKVRTNDGQKCFVGYYCDDKIEN
jgi:hypothetical protein